jgi:hypothetical protein
MRRMLTIGSPYLDYSSTRDYANPKTRAVVTFILRILRILRTDNPVGIPGSRRKLCPRGRTSPQ